MKKIAILQSNYMPWKGYFDIIRSVDEFIIYDDVQYTKNDWRNRNKIKTLSGIMWLTIPIMRISSSQKINEVKISGDIWQKKHWKSIAQNYSHTSFFKEIKKWLQPLYLENKYTYLFEVNKIFIDAICNYLEINTKISYSWDYQFSEGRTQRLVDLCCQAKGSEYISGPAAKNYLEEALFEAKGITVRWFTYDGYPEYPQLYGEFDHHVSILDLLFSCGKKSILYMGNRL